VLRRKTSNGASGQRKVTSEGSFVRWAISRHNRPVGGSSYDFRSGKSYEQAIFDAKFGNSQYLLSCKTVRKMEPYRCEY
jgi:hypothetical protein